MTGGPARSHDGDRSKFQLKLYKLKESDHSVVQPRSGQMGKLLSKAELVGGRRYGEATKMVVKSQDSRANRELIRTLPAPFDAVPGQRRVGQGRCYVVEASSVSTVVGGRRSGKEMKEKNWLSGRERGNGRGKEKLRQNIKFCI